MALAIGHTNLLDIQGSTVSGSKRHDNSTLADIHDLILGKRVRFEPTWYLHPATAGGVIQNDEITVDEGGGDVTVALTAAPTTYRYDALATEIQTELNGAGGLADTYTVTHSETDGKFTIASNGTFILRNSTGSAAWQQLADEMGYTGADTGVAASHTSNVNAKGMGHFLRLQLVSTSGVDMFAIYKPRFLKVRGTSFTPTAEPEEMGVKHFTHASNLGDDPRLWAGTANLETGASGAKLWETGTPIPDINQLQLNVYSSTSTSRQWHYFHMDDVTGGSTDFNYPWLEIGWFGVFAPAGFATIGSALACPTRGNANRRLINVEPGGSTRTQSSFEYTTRGPQHYRVQDNYDLNQETAWQEIEDVRRILGNSQAAVWIPDDERADLNDSYSAFIAKWSNAASYEQEPNDFANIRIDLRMMVD